MPEQAEKKWFEIKAKGDGTAEISIYDQITPPGWGGQSAKSFSSELKALGKVTDLTIRINSPGGDVFEGQAIYSQLKAHKAKKTVYVDGLAASIASIIAMAGDEVVMPENAMMMIHDPSSLVWGTADEMKKLAATLEKVKATLVSVYARKTDLSREEIESMMSDETWMTAEEAVSKGFADRQSDALMLAAHFDLSQFHNVPPAVASWAQARPAALSAKPKEETVMQPITVQDVERNPEIAAHFIDKGKETGKAEGFQAGVKAERERVAAIHKSFAAVWGDAAPASENKVRDGLIDLGTSVADAETHFKTRKLTQITEAAPASAGGGNDTQTTASTKVDLSKLPLEERCKAEWDSTPALREEFHSVGAYTAFQRADQAGHVKILKK